MKSFIYYRVSKISKACLANSLSRKLTLKCPRSYEGVEVLLKCKKKLANAILNLNPDPNLNPKLI